MIYNQDLLCLDIKNAIISISYQTLGHLVFGLCVSFVLILLQLIYDFLRCGFEGFREETKDKDTDA